MLSRIFPKQIDNRFRGYKLAIWIFVPLAFAKVFMSLVAIFSPDGGVQSADGIPLNTLAPKAAKALIGAAAIVGVSNLMMGLLFVLALLRYRAMIPLMFLLMVLEHVGHKGVGFLKPIDRIATQSSGLFSLGLFTLSAIGLVLSLRGAGYLPNQKSEAA